MVGRGLRLSPASGKEDCYIIDIVDNIARSNGMLVSPTLFGLSHDERAELDEGDQSEPKLPSGEKLNLARLTLQRKTNPQIPSNLAA